MQPTVLVVEDEALLREIIALELADAGYQVIEAEDGPSAFAALEGPEPIDLLLTDIRLPGPYDGWAIAESARALKPELPVIYATGFTADEPRLVAGAQLLRKPFRPATLIQAAISLGVRPQPN